MSEEEETPKEYCDRILEMMKHRLLTAKDIEIKKKNPYQIKWEDED